MFVGVLFEFTMFTTYYNPLSLSININKFGIVKFISVDLGTTVKKMLAISFSTLYPSVGVAFGQKKYETN